MADFVELLREVMTLTSNVNDLKEQIARLNDQVAANTERIVKLENREELLLEKAKNAYLLSSTQLNAQLMERVIALEKGISPGETGKQLPSDKKSREGES